MVLVLTGKMVYLTRCDIIQSGIGIVELWLLLAEKAISQQSTNIKTYVWLLFTLFDLSYAWFHDR